MPAETISHAGKEIRSLQPKETRYEVHDSSVKGLRLRVSPTGSKTWTLWYRTRQGKGSRYTLGEFPGMSLSDARTDARTMKDAIKKGGDPQGDLQASRGKERADRAAAERAKVEAERGTVEAIGTAALAAMKLRPKTRLEWGRLFRKEIVPAFGPVLAKDLSVKEVELWGDRIKERAPVVSNRAHNLLLRLFGWASEKRRGEDHPILAVNQLAGVKVPAPDAEILRDRVLSPAELQAIVRGLDALETLADCENGDRAAYVAATRLLLETGVRREGVVGARRDEFTNLDDPKTAKWTIPPGREGTKRPMRSKQKAKAHIIPLTEKAIEIVKARLEVIGDGNDFLFPVASERRVAGSDRPMTWSSHYMALLKAVADALHGKPMDNWRIHDFRHAVASHMRDEFKVRRDVVSMILGHALGGPVATGIYDHSELLDERRAALAAWSAWLENLRSGVENASKVLLFARPA